MKRTIRTAEQAHHLYKLNRNLSNINESKLNSLVEHALKDLLSEQQISTKQIIDALYRSSAALGTDEEGLVAAVKMIPDYRTLQQVDSILKAGAERAATIGPNKMFSLSNGSRVNTTWLRSFGNTEAQYYSVRKIIDGEFGIGDDSYKRKALSHLTKITKTTQSTIQPGAFPPPSVQAMTSLAGSEKYIRSLISNGYINQQDFNMWLESIKDLESIYDHDKVYKSLVDNIPDIWRRESVLSKDGRTKSFLSAGGLGVKETVNVKRVFLKYWMEKVSKENPEFQSTLIQIPGLSKPINEIIDFVASFIGPQALLKNVADITIELGEFLKSNEGQQITQISEELYSLLTDNNTYEFKYPDSKPVNGPQIVIVPPTKEKSNNEIAAAYVTAIENALKLLATNKVNEQKEFVTTSADSSQVIIDYNSIEKQYGFNTLEDLKKPTLINAIVEQYKNALKTTTLYAESENRDELLEATALCIVYHTLENGDTAIKDVNVQTTKTTLPVSSAEILKLLDDEYKTNSDNQAWWNKIKSTIQQQKDFNFDPAEKNKLIQNIGLVIDRDPSIKTELQQIKEDGFGLDLIVENSNIILESLGNGGVVENIINQFIDIAKTIGIVALCAFVFIELLWLALSKGKASIILMTIRGIHGVAQEALRQYKWIKIQMFANNPETLVRFIRLLRLHKTNKLTPALRKELIKIANSYGFKITQEGVELYVKTARRAAPTNLMKTILLKVETDAQIQILFQQAMNKTLTGEQLKEYSQVGIAALKAIAENPGFAKGGYFFKIRPRVPIRGNKRKTAILARNVIEQPIKKTTKFIEKAVDNSTRQSSIIDPTTGKPFTIDKTGKVVEN